MNAFIKIFPVYEGQVLLLGKALDAAFAVRSHEAPQGYVRVSGGPLPPPPVSSIVTPEEPGQHEARIVAEKYAAMEPAKWPHEAEPTPLVAAQNVAILLARAFLKKEADRQYHMAAINRLAAAVGKLGCTSDEVVEAALSAIAPTEFDAMKAQKDAIVQRERAALVDQIVRDLDAEGKASSLVGFPASGTIREWLTAWASRSADGGSHG